ncbi:MAG TPA: heavy metal sensor histidine kinase [Chloroflexota bacterium]|nr:heavy metal sensor histidine kinase [Chloroflexota bacterium]
MFLRVVSVIKRQSQLTRFKLTLWYTGLTAVVLAAFVGSVFAAYSYYHDNSSRENLVSTLQDAFENQLQITDESCAGRTRLNFNVPCHTVRLHWKNSTVLNQSDVSIRFIGPEGKIVTDKADSTSKANSLNDSASKNAVNMAKANGKPVAVDSAKYRIVSIPFNVQGSEVVGLISQPLDHIQAQVDALRYILIYASLAILLCSAAGGWLLAGRALKPIDDITQRAQHITAQDLSQRLNLDQDDELGRMAATFDDMIARLEEAFERHKRFTSDASHELRTPLTVMQADISLALARPRSAEEYRQALVSLEEEVARLSTIVNDLLMLTRVDVDPAQLQYQPIALHELLGGLCRRVQAVAADRCITVDAERLQPATVLGDPTRLRQLFTNLLDNAVTYTPDGGRVTVTLERTRDGARIQVSDTGIGISPEHLPHIFERFFRTAEAREQNSHGTGLGLAISRSIVQAHHGEITVGSVPHEGTTFTVVLPANGRKPARHIHGLRALAPGVA